MPALVSKHQRSVNRPRSPLQASGRRCTLRQCRALAAPEHANSASSPIGSTETKFVAETKLPTRHGRYRLRGYRHTVDGWKSHTEPTAIIHGHPEGGEHQKSYVVLYRVQVAVRVHDACYTSEVLGSMKCDCAEQLQQALEHIRDKSPGVVIYLQQEGRGIGLANKIAAYALQEKGYDTVDANRKLGLPDDCREYSSVMNILKDLNIKSLRLITNNPRKIRHLEELGILVTGRIPCIIPPGEFSQGYLQAKGARMDHMLAVVEKDGQVCYVDSDVDSETEEPACKPIRTIDEQTF